LTKFNGKTIDIKCFIEFCLNIPNKSQVEFV
jgi:hypothetical protein